MKIFNAYSLFTFFAIWVLSCSGTSSTQKEIDSSIDFHYGIDHRDQKEPSLVVGAENTFAYLSLLKNKRVAVVANHTSFIKNKHLVDSLVAADINIVKVFAPEHGFRGKADAGEQVNDEIDSGTGISIMSLYGKNKKPTPESLSDVDIVLFDIQDVGVRFYTYISTLHYIMEACAESAKPLVVLDRPNPHAHYVDGPILEDEFKSFVGMHNVPVVYGLTIGEYAHMINEEGWLANGIKCDLTTVLCMNYDRSKQYTIPIKPSPNLPNALSVQLYPSLCFFEGTSISAGRGTNLPFQCFGHDKLKGDYQFTPQENEGSKYPKFKGQEITGKNLSNQDVALIYTKASLDLSWLLYAYANMENAGQDFFLNNNFFEKLAGTKNLRKQIMEGYTETEIKQTWEVGKAEYLKTRNKYLKY